MMKIAYLLFIGLMLAGNCFGLFQLIYQKQTFIEKFPELTPKNIFWLQLLPVMNIAGLAGMLFFKSWSPYVAVAGALLVIVADVYLNIRYHLYVAIPSALILLWLIVFFWNKFK
jgi:hypothetical protein